MTTATGANRATTEASGRRGALLPSPFRRRTIAPSLLYPIVLLVVPLGFLGGDAHLIQTLTGAALTAASCLGLAVLTGWAKLVSFCQGAMYGVGAYVGAILATRWDVPFIALVLAGVVSGAIVGLVIALPTLRLDGVYLGISTIGLQMLITGLMLKGGDLTGGPAGIAGIPMMKVFGLEATTINTTYVFVCTWMIIVTLFVSLLWRSRYGREMRLAGHSHALTESVGASATRRKIMAFAIASSIGAATGVLHAHVYGVIDPTSFGIQVSATMLIVVLLGGLHGRVNSVISAAFILTVLPEYLRGFANVRLMVYGGALMALIVFAPGGLSSAWDSIKRLSCDIQAAIMPGKQSEMEEIKP